MTGINNFFIEKGLAGHYRVVQMQPDWEHESIGSDLRKRGDDMKAAYSVPDTDRGTATIMRRFDTQVDQMVSLLQRNFMLRRKLADTIGPYTGDRNITAWIAVNDELALACMDVLAGARIRIPGRVAVAGFDDGFEASEHKLTSYNFNGRAALSALVNHVLYYNPRMAKQPFRGVEQAEGFMVSRRSC